MRAQLSLRCDGLQEVNQKGQRDILQQTGITQSRFNQFSPNISASSHDERKKPQPRVIAQGRPGKRNLKHHSWQQLEESDLGPSVGFNHHGPWTDVEVTELPRVSATENRAEEWLGYARRTYDKSNVKTIIEAGVTEVSQHVGQALMTPCSLHHDSYFIGSQFEMILIHLRGDNCKNLWGMDLCPVKMLFFTQNKYNQRSLDTQNRPRR